MKNKFVCFGVVGTMLSLATVASAALDTGAALTAITDSTTAATTVAFAGLAVTGLFLGIAIIRKAIRGSK